MRSSRGHSTGRRLAVATAAIVMLALLASAAIGVSYGGRVLPRTQVAGVDLGGASRSEARERLRTALAVPRPLRVRTPGRTLIVQPHEAGFAPDVDATVERALAAGRSTAVKSLASRVLWILDPGEVDVAGAIDETAFKRMNRAIGAAVSRQAFHGALVVDPLSLDVSAKPPRPGARIDKRQLTRRLRAALERAVTGSISVPVRSVPVPPRAAVEQVAREATEYLEAPLRIGRVDIPPRRLARALTIVPTRGGRSARLGTDRRGRIQLAAHVARAVDRRVREAALSAPARAQALEAKGDVAWRPQRAPVIVRRSATGRSVRRPAAAESIEAAVREGRHRARLPMRRTQPRLTTASARRVRFLIGTFTTRYPPGQPRVKNIQRIAAAVDGTVVHPGERFSLNGVSGPRTRAKGYVKAPFIADGKIVPSVGGGVSQFSTTMYNAAYFAGLTINAHQPHSLYIDRYPPGRESTLNYPDIDLVWTNDTEAPVLVRTSSDATSVTVSLYGANGGRRVRAETGARRAVPGKEFAITVTRVIRYGDGRTARQPITTQYDRPRDPEE